MPIRSELKHFYSREWRTVTRPRILARAGNRCEQCGVPNHAKVWRRILSGRTWWSRYATRWRDARGVLATPPRYPDSERRIRIVLTIAHLNHTPGDDRDENLRALCQWCHLNLDQGHHRESRQARKDASRPLIQEATA